jgi:catechol 2,3-dioxygenase-like lactoylglutathione lyase family enzyme
MPGLRGMERTMQLDLDHPHVFASDIDATVKWWTEMLGAKVVFDVEFMGVRNVRMTVGRGAIIFMAQAPKVVGPGSVHHLGIATDDLAGLVASLEAKGVKLYQPIIEAGTLKIALVVAPDEVMLELFEASGR